MFKAMVRHSLSLMQDEHSSKCTEATGDSAGVGTKYEQEVTSIMLTG